MRWLYFIPLLLAGMLLQTTVLQVLWVRTSLGWIGPELLAAVAVFAGLRVRSATDAALAGWALGLAVDLSITGEGMGLLPLLYAAGAAAVYGLRGALYRDRAVAQMLLTLAFCLFVYAPWTVYQAAMGSGFAGIGARLLQAAGLAAYTAVLAPFVVALLDRLPRLLAAPAARGAKVAMYRRRLKYLLALMGVMMLAVVVRLVHLQLVCGADYRRQAEATLTYAELLPAARGQILDRNGNVLAADAPCFDFCLDYRMLTWEQAASAPASAPAAPGLWSRLRTALGGAPPPPPRPRLTDPEKWAAGEIRKLVRKELTTRPSPVAPAVREEVQRQAERAFRDRVARTWELAEEITGAARNEMARAADAAVRRIEAIRAHVEAGGTTGAVLEESQPQPIVPALDEATAVALREHLDEMVGASVVPSHRRRYPFGPAACHLIGTLGPVRADEPRLVRPEEHLAFKDMTDRYLPGDAAGQAGVERLCEDLLCGRRGWRLRHRTGGTLEEIPPAAGQDVHLTIDIRLQQALAEALNRPGAVVVLDIQSAEVLAMVSLPGYDLNEFRRQYSRLLADHVDFPLLNRALAVRYPPGSSFKPVAALAALSTGTINPQTTFTCRGYMFKPGEFRCDNPNGHGTLDLVPAIQRSCNVYFYHVGERLGLARMCDWLEQFGFSHPPGVLPREECASVLPPRTGPEATAAARFLAIGQGAVGVTPTHVANAMATIARDGEFVAPALVSELSANRPHHQLEIRRADLDTVREGMYLVVNSPAGTAYKWARDPEIAICGKTGTAQTSPRRIDSNGDHKIDDKDEIVRKGDTAWFVGFAPYKNPKIAFAVMVEYSEFHGGPACGPIARTAVQLCKKLGYIP